MADWLGVVLVLTVVGMNLALLGFIAWLKIEHRKEVDALTSKLMAKDYREYAHNRPQEISKAPKKEEKEKKNTINDPQLGRVY